MGVTWICALSFYIHISQYRQVFTREWTTRNVTSTYLQKLLEPLIVFEEYGKKIKPFGTFGTLRQVTFMGCHVTFIGCQVTWHLLGVTWLALDATWHLWCHMTCFECCSIFLGCHVTCFGRQVRFMGFHRHVLDVKGHLWGVTWHLWGATWHVLDITWHLWGVK